MKRERTFSTSLTPRDIRKTPLPAKYRFVGDLSNWSSYRVRVNETYAK